MILLCFSCDSLDSLVEAETVITPELLERYPGVPIVLVATKCDLKAVEGQGAAQPAFAARNAVDFDARRRVWRPSCSSPDMTLHEAEEAGGSGVAAAAAAAAKDGPSSRELESARATAAFK